MPERTDEACVGSEHPCLEGHFPGQPVVPAVWMLDHLGRLIARQLPGATLTAVPSAKFLRPLGPGQTLVFTLDLKPAEHRARFRIESEGHLAAQGELRFRVDPL